MNSYRGLHSRYYDLIYADKPYDEQAAFVVELLRTRGVGGGRLLDVACGTGRHAAAFARGGFAVTGVDYNDELLAVARERVPDVEFVQADMRQLDLGGGFDAVTCLFDSIGYPLTDEGVAAALASIGAQVCDGALVVVEFLFAPTMHRDAAPVRVRRWPLSDHQVLLRISETTLDPEDPDRFAVSFELLALDETTGRFERWQETQENRAFDLETMTRLLSTARLELLQYLPAYEEGDVVPGETWHVLAVARPFPG